MFNIFFFKEKLTVKATGIFLKKTETTSCHTSVKYIIK